MIKRILIIIAFSLCVSTVFAGDLKTMAWSEIVAQAKQEGQLNWFQWFLQSRFREQVQAFEAEYGIKVKIPTGSHDDNLKKFLAERNRQVGDIDVLSMGGEHTAKFKVEELFFGRIADILPEGKKLRTKINGGDGKGYAVAYWGNQTGLAYDSSRVKESELPQSLADLEDWMKKNPQNLGFNTVQGGSGPAFFYSISRELLPGVDFTSGDDSDAKIENLKPAWKWFTDRKNQYILTASNADSLTRLNDGEFTLVPAWEDHLGGLQSKGEIAKKVKFYIPNFKMPGGGNVVGLPANAKNKAAALVFIHWLTSAKTQARFNKEMGAAPQHPDASDKFALVSAKQRQNTTDWHPQPFKAKFEKAFIENVALD